MLNRLTIVAHPHFVVICGLYWVHAEIVIGVMERIEVMSLGQIEVTLDQFLIHGLRPIGIGFLGCDRGAIVMAGHDCASLLRIDLIRSDFTSLVAISIAASPMPYSSINSRAFEALSARISISVV